MVWPTYFQLCIRKKKPEDLLCGYDATALVLAMSFHGLLWFRGLDDFVCALGTTASLPSVAHIMWLFRFLTGCYFYPLFSV
jgi:hypothetical protein